jgi:hypothetical protein
MVTEAFKRALIELKIDPATDLADGVRMDRTKEGAVFVCVHNGEDVCQYCFKPFDERDRQYESMDLQIGDGFVRVHKSCHEKKQLSRVLPPK